MLMNVAERKDINAGACEAPLPDVAVCERALSGRYATSNNILARR